MIFDGWVAAVTLLAAATAAAQPAASDLPAANPSRPTVTDPATLTPVGYLQFENGILFAAESPGVDKQFSFSQATKLAVNRRVEFFVLSQPWASTSFGDGYRSDDGDVSVGVQGVLLPGEKLEPTVALSYAKRVHTGSAADLDIGGPNQSAIVLVSGEIKKCDYYSNAIVNEQVSGSVRRAQYGQTLYVSRSFSKWTFGVELWHFTQPFLRGNAVGNLYAVGYAVRPNLVFDAGFDHGLTSSSTQWEGFAGFTYLLPHRLWRKR